MSYHCSVRGGKRFNLLTKIRNTGLFNEEWLQRVYKMLNRLTCEELDILEEILGSK